jgi:hypothetical protein
MSFSINGIPNIENIGTLGLYGGTTDPDGWVICDGQSRTNTTGTYDNLFLQTTGKNYGYGPTWTNGAITITVGPTSVTLKDVRGVAVSDVGTVVLADRSNTGLYISQNNGATWASVSNLPSIPFSCVDISQDGTKIIAAANVVGYGLYLSINSGSTWSQLYTNNGLPTDLISMDNGSNKVAISNDGTKISVAYTNGFAYFSSNSGATFQNVSPAGPTGTSVATQNVAKNYWGLGMSKDGSKLVAAVNNDSYVPNIANLVWKRTPGTGLPASASWLGTETSHSGQYMTVVVNGGSIYLSSNYGNDWFVPAGAGAGFSYNNAAISSTGQYILGAPLNMGGGQLSTSYGQYWTKPGELSNVSAAYCGMSSSGQYMLYSVYDGAITGVYMSSNYGKNFKLNPGIPTGQTYISARTSATGQYMAVSSLTNTYISANYGSTWTLNPTGVTKGYGISISGTGQYILIGANDVSVKLALSSNYGVSFSQTNASITNAAWNSVSVSYTGQYMAAGISNGTFHLSSSYGAYWTSNPGSGIAATGGRTGIAISSNAQYILASVTNNSVYLASNPYWSSTQNNIAKTWSQTPGSGLPATANFWTVATSYTGQYVSTVVDNGSLYLSTNYGINWKVPSGTSSSQYRGIAMSATGEYMLSCSWSNGPTQLSTSYGQYWTTSPGGLSTNNGGFTAVSADGKYMLLSLYPGGLYISSNYGKNFILNAGISTNPTYYGCCVSENGQYMGVAGNSYTYISSNSGASWTLNPPGISTPNNYAISMSGSGKYVLSATQSGSATALALSVNYGVSFSSTNSSVTSSNWNQVYVSYSGKYMTACIGTGSVYLSSDFGLTWTTTPGSGLQASANYRGVAISGNELYMVACVVSGSVYLSSSSSSYWLSQNIQLTQNWIKTPGTGLPGAANYYTCAMSGTGQYIATGITGGSLYLSSNYGVNWEIPSGTINGTYRGTSISATGQYIFIAAYQNSAQLSTSYGVYWTTNPGGIVNDNYGFSAISANGQYILCTTQSAKKIILSSNYGANFFTPASVSSSLGYYGCSMSASGQYMIISSSTVANISTSYGAYWSSTIGNLSITMFVVAISGTGQYILIIPNTGSAIALLLSTNYGNNFSSVNTGVTIGGGYNGSVSYTGQYMAAVANNSNLYYSSSYGTYWTMNPGSGLTASTTYISVAISLNAQYIMSVVTGGEGFLCLTSNGSPTVDGGISYSSDSGNNWSFGGGYLNGPYHNSVAISADGSTILAGYQGSVPYISIGSSNIFNQISAIPNGNTYGMALSSTGQNAIVTQQTGPVYSQQRGGIYTTTNYGTNWASGTTGQLILEDFYGAASISQNGQVAVACAGGLAYSSTTVNTAGQIAFSTGSGTTFIVYTSTTITPQNAATSSNGQYMLATSNSSGNGFLYLSTNSGAFWSAPLGTGIAYQLAWNGCAVSPTTNSSGYYVMAATVTGQSVYISVNSGVTWLSLSSTLPIAAWSSISMDTDGSIMAVIASGSQIYVSSNTGSTWQAYGSALAYTDIAVSLTGQYMTATVSGGQIYVSTSFGTTWTPYGPTAYWLDIHMSGAANIMVAAVNNGPLYISTNTGQAWSTISTTNNVLPSSANWGNVGISSDGTYLVATISGGSIYTSTNGGAFWANVQTTVTGTSAGASWSNCLAISGNGSTIVAGQSNTSGGSGLLYVSINTVFIKTISTSTWSANNIPASINVESGTQSITTQAWTSVSISSNGQVMAASSSNSLGGYLYLSTNTGTNWSLNTTLSSSQINVSSVALSTSGQYILVSVSSSNLYVSTNTGTSWTTISNAQPWTEVAVSSDGQAMVAVGTNIQPYVSTNYGKNWSSYGTAQNYTAVSVSSTGNNMAAGTTGGQIYLSSNTGANWAALTNSTTANWTGISMSSTGQFIVASSNLALYLSTNYGLTWTSLANYPGLQNSGNSWSSVSISSDGLFIVASTNTGYIYASINGGSTWALASSVADQQRAWQMISISGDGSKAIAINNPGQVYTSTDGQAFTFTPITMPTLTSLDGTTLRYIAKI